MVFSIFAFQNNKSLYIAWACFRKAMGLVSSLLQCSSNADPHTYKKHNMTFTTFKSPCISVGMESEAVCYINSFKPGVPFM